jgi:8-oxo-dGTP diphosphatase
MVFERDGEVLFLLRENTGYKDGEYGLPSGRVEDNESFSAGAIRETQEEVGLTLGPKNMRHLHTMHRFSDLNNDVRVDVFFAVDNWEGEPKNAEPHKHSELAWLELNKLPDNVMDYVAYALKQIAQGKTYSEFGW